MAHSLLNDKLTLLLVDMSGTLSAIESAKRKAGYMAVDQFVKSNMVIGLGTGSTAYFAVERVGQKLANGELNNIQCVPTSERTREQAESLNIPLTTLDALRVNSSKRYLIAVAIDGADDVDSTLNLIKGGGGALLREKLVEIAAEKFICIVDESKLHKTLGRAFPLPVEIVPFGYRNTINAIINLPEVYGKLDSYHLRRGDVVTNKQKAQETALGLGVTDNGNYILDLKFNTDIENPVELAENLKRIVGVVEHGLFCSMAQTVIVARQDGSCIQYGEGGLTPDW